MKNFEIETSRLILRNWKAEDAEDFAAMNADEKVMEFFPTLLSREESDKHRISMQDKINATGKGFYAVELKSANQLIGFVGLNTPKPEMPFGSCVEIGWRLAKAYWQQGYAYEAAIASLKYAFQELKLKEVVSFTSTLNTPSQNLMIKLGMRNAQQNFMHPSLASNHPLAEHVLYKITKKEFEAILV